MKYLLLLLLITQVYSKPDWLTNFHHRFSTRWEQQLEREVDKTLGHLRDTLDRLPSVIRTRIQPKPEPLVEKVDTIHPDVEILTPEQLRPETDEELPTPERPQRPSIFGDHLGFPSTSMFGDTLGVNLFPGFEILRRRDWWKGPNVCVSREEEEEVTNSTSTFPFHAMMEFTHCQDLQQRYTCETKRGQDGIQKTFKVTYECCYGFVRKPGTDGCTEGGNLLNLYDTLSALDDTEFLYLVNTLEMGEKLKKENLTLFVPTDDALLEYIQDNQVEYNVIPELKRKKRQQNSMANMILNHMTKGFHFESSMGDEQIFESEEEGGSIRINRYGRSPLGQKLVTSNCARITDSDNMATNGIVHTIAQVMKPVTKTIADIITTDPQFSILTTLLEKANLMSSLRDEGSYTLFAPTDYALKSDPTLLEKLTKGKGCLQNILKNHLVKNVICSVAVQTGVHVRTLQQSTVHLLREEDDRVSVNGVKLQDQDMLGTNGVVHSIHGVLMPESARSLSKALLDANLTEFHSLLDENDLLETLDNMDNFTVFAPSNDAIRSLPPDMRQSLSKNPDHFKNVLMYHVTNPEMLSCDVDNNMLLSTAFFNRNIRINAYRQHNLFNRMSHRLTAQCARLHLIDHRTCSGRVHLLDRLLIPPTGTVMDFLANHENFTRMSALLQDSGLAERLIDEGPWTVLAVPDYIFDTLPEDRLSELLNDKEKAKAIASLHVIPEMICCHGVGRNLLFGNVRYHTIGGGRLKVHRSDSGRIRAGPSTVMQCDHTSTNGVVHVVNSLIMPKNLRRENPFHRIRLPGLFEIQFHSI